MNRFLLLIFSFLIVGIYFLTTKVENKIKSEMEIEASIIAQSSEVFLSNFAIDELEKKLKLDMNVRNIRAIEIKDLLLNKNIIIAYKDDNNRIKFVQELPSKYKKLPRLKKDIVKRKSYGIDKIGQLVLYYDGESNINLINKYTQLDFSTEEKAYLNQKKIINMCIDPYWMPFEEIKDGKHIGITADYMDIFRTLIGIPIKFIPTKSWEESLTKSKNRECDILSLISKTKERSKYMDFTTPYINNPIVIATKIGIPFIENIGQIKDKKIAIVRGYSLIGILKKDYPEMEIVEVESLKDGLRAVEKNKIFAYLDNSTVINHAIQNGFLGSVTISGKINYNIEFSIATRNDEPLLNDIFEEAVLSIDENTKANILHKWIKNNYNLKTDYTLVFQLLFVFTLIILGTIYWNRKLSLLNKELSIERDKAKKLTEAKSEFLANMSHEIRTPMNGIIGMSHLALDCKLDKKSKNYIHKIDKSAKSLLNIINDILDFSKMEAGKLNIERVDFYLNEVIENVINLTEIKINEKKLKLIVHNEYDNSKPYHGDSHRLTQIIMNLMGNAIKFTNIGTITLKVINKPNNLVEFSIADTGIGLSSIQIDKLFKSFSQGDLSTTRKYGGTGLGLSISKQLVELLDGKIWVDSVEGKGSTFSFEVTLPQNLESIEIKKEKKVDDFPQIKEFFRNLENVKILLVEDNFINQEIVRGLLENSGIIIDSVQNGKDDVEKIELYSSEYDLILMDMKMPIMNGIEASKRIRKINTVVPIIALTANALDTDKNLAREAGMNDYLHKPIDIEKLYRLIYKYLEPIIGNRKEIKKSCSLWDKFQYLDYERALKQLNNNEKLYLKILKDFKTNYNNVSFELLEEEERKLVIHTLKGLSGNIGAFELYKSVKNVERDNDPLLLEVLYKRLNEVMLDISQLDESKDESKNNELISDSLKIELFKELEEALINKRPKQITLVLSKIENYELKDEDSVLFESIKTEIKKYKYNEALNIMNL